MNTPPRGKQAKGETTTSFSLFPPGEKKLFYGSYRQFLFQVS